MLVIQSKGVLCHMNSTESVINTLLCRERGSSQIRVPLPKAVSRTEKDTGVVTPKNNDGRCVETGPEGRVLTAVMD